MERIKVLMNELVEMDNSNSCIKLEINFKNDFMVVNYRGHEVFGYNIGETYLETIKMLENIKQEYIDKELEENYMKEVL